MITSIVAICVLIFSAADAVAEAVFAASYPEGLFIQDENTFYFAEMTADRVEKVYRGTRMTFFSREGCGPTGVTRIDEGRLAIACHAGASILVLDNDGRILATLRSSTSGVRLRNPNDINGDGLGGAFFSDPGAFALDAGSTGRIYRLLPDLSIKLVASGLAYPNGVAYLRESRTLFVSEHLGKRILRFRLDLDHTSPVSGDTFFDFRRESSSYDWSGLTGPDGLRALPTGELLVAIYGLSRFVILHGCEAETWIKVHPRFVTSVGYKSGVLGVAGALTNVRFPYEGTVELFKVMLHSPCERKN